MKIFVTGGTGTIGNLLVYNFLEANHEISVITRDKSSVENPWKDQVNLIEGDIKDYGEWVNQLDGHDAVVNLVGEDVFSKRWTKKQKQRLFDSRVLPTRNIAKVLAEKEDMPEIFISVSGTDYYPTSKTKVFAEDSENGHGFLADLSKEWEAPVKSLIASDIRTVLFRMGAAFTYTGGGIERMFIPHKFFVGGWIGSGDQVYSWTHIKDFVGLIQWALENDDIEGIYNGVAGNTKMKDLAVIGGKIMGRWTWTWAPGFVLYLILGERASILLKGRTVSNDKVLEAGYEFQFPNAQSALEDILEKY